MISHETGKATKCDWEALTAAIMAAMTLLSEHLTGGDRRSTGNADAVVALVRDDPERFDELWACLKNTDPIVRMRAADALEKLTRTDASHLQPYRQELLSNALDDGTQEVRWHLIPMTSRLTLSDDEAAAFADCLQQRLEKDASRIVRVTALQAAYDLSCRHPGLESRVDDMLGLAAASGVASLTSRVRKLSTARKR